MTEVLQPFSMSSPWAVHPSFNMGSDLFVIHTLSHKVSSSLCFPIPAFAQASLQTRCRTSCVCCRKRLQPQQLNHFVVCSSFLACFREAKIYLPIGYFHALIGNWQFWIWYLHLNFPSSSLVNFEFFFSLLMITHIREDIHHQSSYSTGIINISRPWWESIEIWAIPCCFEIHAKYLNSATPHQALN